MVIYMTRVMGYEPAFASVQLMLFEGTCYLTPILGAWLADSAWGRFKTILVFSIIYFVVSSHLGISSHYVALLYRISGRQKHPITSFQPICANRSARAEIVASIGVYHTEPWGANGVLT